MWLNTEPRVGYIAKHENCFLFSDVDECSDPNLEECRANSVCRNNEGSYECECNKGYIKNDNGDCEGK